jgi:microsomal dipeptidase-like Zn-dependent dipeptidase
VAENLSVKMNYPVIDLHCDLLCYLQDAPNADPFNKEAIGCSLPSLKQGNVKLQVMAIYTATEKGSTELALQQSLYYKNLLTQYNNPLSLSKNTDLSSALASPKLNMLAAVENASGFCEEDEPLENGFKKLEQIISNTQGILYIGLTHHGENRFGGGNSTSAGLKEDGKALLNYLNGKKIAIDFSHTSDALANDILDHLSKFNLDIPVLASHSNFRKIFDHPRNLPDDIAKEIIKRKGVIGINFLRAFINNTNSEAIYDHILHGISLGPNSICFGADYFYTDSHPDQSRKPFFFKEQENAACYPSLLKRLSEKVSPDLLEGISHKNAIDFIGRLNGLRLH